MKNGFTLIELLIALAISAILFCLADSSYTAYIARAERNRAEMRLMQLAAALEVYAGDHQGSYAGATITTVAVGDELTSYQIVIAALSDAHFSLQAVPIGGQAVRDAQCGTLTLTEANIRGAEKGGCW